MSALYRRGSPVCLGLDRLLRAWVDQDLEHATGSELGQHLVDLGQAGGDRPLVNSVRTGCNGSENRGKVIAVSVRGPHLELLGQGYAKDRGQWLARRREQHDCSLLRRRTDRSLQGRDVRRRLETAANTPFP